MSNYYDDATQAGWQMVGSEWNTMGSDILNSSTNGSPLFSAGAVTGSWTAGYFIGDGSQLTGLPPSGETNTGSNLGAGTAIFAQKTGVNLDFKTLVAGTSITLGSDANTITINSSASGGGASFTYTEKINGEAYTGNLGYFVVPDELNTKLIKEVRISVLGLNTGQALKVDIRKNGTASTDSIFTSDIEIEIGTAQSATNGIYQTGCDTSGSTVGTAGTTIDAARDDLASDDVLYVYVTQVGSTLAGTDLRIEVIIG